MTTAHVHSAEWRLAILSGAATLSHFLFIVFVTFFLILTEDPSKYPTPRLLYWAGFLGLLSTSLAVIQYAPQLWTTWKAKTVGALSIPMMCIQTPGAILMVTSIAIRPGTNWTSWATYAAAGIMQGSLLVMCIAWKVRQKRLDIDDFGRPLHSREREDHDETRSEATIQPASAAQSETTPLLANGDQGVNRSANRA